MRRLSLLLLLFVVSCSTTGSSISILDNSQCELPCWNGITPGKTSQEDALQIITGLKDVDPKKTVVIDQSWKIFNKRIWFYLQNGSQQTENQTDGAIYFLNDKVVALSLHRNVGLTFRELVKKAGEPENIISLPFDGATPVVIAIFPSNGIKMELYARSNDIKPETEIDNVMFFDSSHYEDLLDAGMFSLGGYNASDTKKIMYPWKGYGSIEELYPPRFP